MNRLKSIQGLRALAFLEVFLAHCGLSPFQGVLGVSLFMLMSGFCMALNYLPRVEAMPVTPAGCARFALDKVKKLYVLHVAMTLCAMLIRGVPATPGGLARLLINILLLQSLFPFSDVYFAYNGISWYLSCYMLVCLLAPGIVRLASRIVRGAESAVKARIFALMALCLGVMAGIGYAASACPILIGDDFAKWLTYICPAYRLLDFAFGVLLGALYVRCRGRDKLSASGGLALLAGAAVAALVYLRLEAFAPAGFKYNLMMLPVAALMLLCAVRSGGAIGRAVSGRLITRLGDMSSCAFLIHQIVIQSVRMLMARYGVGQGAVGALALFCVSFALTFALTQLYILLDGRLRRRMRKA